MGGETRRKSPEMVGKRSNRGWSGALMLKSEYQSALIRPSLERSDATYTIEIDDRAENWYDQDTRTVYINPKSEFVIASSGETQSSLVIGAHEISHAAEHDRIGDEKFRENLMQPMTKTGPGVSPEENRATEVEKKVGKELRLSTREHYRDVKK